MPSAIRVPEATAQWLFADHSGDFGAAPTTGANSLIIGTPTDVQLDLTGVAAGGGARHSAKADLGALRARLLSLDVCLEFETAPTDGGVVDFLWAPSPSGTAGTGNPGQVTGSDAAITDTAGNRGELIRIGSLYVVNNVISIGHVGILEPPHRYGSLLVINFASTALRSTATAADETHITLTEVVEEAQ